MRSRESRTYIHRACRVRAEVRVRDMGLDPAVYGSRPHVLLATFKIDPARGIGVAGNWGRRPGWGVDLEGQFWVCWPPSLHVERLYQTRAAALRALRFLEWCVDGLTDEQLVECARVTDGRLL